MSEFEQICSPSGALISSLVKWDFLLRSPCLSEENGWTGVESEVKGQAHYDRLRPSEGIILRQKQRTGRQGKFCRPKKGINQIDWKGRDKEQ